MLLMLTLAGAAWSAPFTPASDSEVLETLPGRHTPERLRDLRDMRAAWARQPQDPDIAARLARRYYDEVAAEGDPRWVGYAQAVLGPWWTAPSPPPRVRVMRAVLRQFNHEFDAALADLEAAASQDPTLGEAWAWQAAIHMVRADYPAARRACERFAPMASPLIAVACTAGADSLSGQAEAAARALRVALAAAPGADAAERLWALTRLAEIEERLGRHREAEAAFREAAALGLVDNYLLAAYADFLLDRQRPAEVLALLDGRGRSDTLLLRLVLAAHRLGDARLGAWQAELAARFEAARRSRSTHEKEEARFLMATRPEDPRALELARHNFEVQREPADARVLLEAALARRDPAAARPVLDWMARWKVQSVALQALAEQLKGLR
ncbi:MAG TPA: hypothetical protein VGD46_22110 [Rhizobacter sp.]